MIFKSNPVILQVSASDPYHSLAVRLNLGSGSVPSHSVEYKKQFVCVSVRLTLYFPSTSLVKPYLRHTRQKTSERRVGKVLLTD